MSDLKLLIIAQVVMVAVFIGSVKYIHDRFAEMSCSGQVVATTPKVKIQPKYAPADHKSEEKHKFEKLVKRTEG